MYTPIKTIFDDQFVKVETNIISSKINKTVFQSRVTLKAYLKMSKQVAMQIQLNLIKTCITVQCRLHQAINYFHLNMNVNKQLIR